MVFGLVVVVAPTRRFDERRWANYVFGSVIVGSLLILGYFVFQYLTA